MNDKLTTADGLKLHVREWPTADARGTVLIVHGLGEHIGRYAHEAARLNGWGWNAAFYAVSVMALLGAILFTQIDAGRKLVPEATSPVV